MSGEGRRKRLRQNYASRKEGSLIDKVSSVTERLGKDSKKFRSFREKYHLLETIGEGTYGVVYKAVELASGRLVALKKIRTNNPEEGLPATSIREVKLLKYAFTLYRLKHCAAGTSSIRTLFVCMECFTSLPQPDAKLPI